MQNNCCDTEGGANMSVYAIAKKDPYIISSEEARVVFSARRNEDAHKSIVASANKLQTTCFKKGVEIKAERATLKG